jgi:hypothetical protein
LMMDHELDRLPKFLRLLIFSYSGFSQKLSTYNNLVAMAATAVCNYTNTNCWSNAHLVFVADKHTVKKLIGDYFKEVRRGEFLTFR